MKLKRNLWFYLKLYEENKKNNNLLLEENEKNKNLIKRFEEKIVLLSNENNILRTQLGKLNQMI